MPIASFNTLTQDLFQQLKGLDTRLVYHNIDHTADVLAQTIRIAADEHITDPRQLYLLKVAALYHDAGFLRIYDGHEEESCGMFLADADKCGVKEEEKIIVQELIMATKLTNQPHTHLEKILRDADVDYLGRADFDEISNRLKEELLKFGFIKSDAEWEDRQLAFLKQHRYHTKSSNRLREPVKQKNYRALLT